MKYIAIFLVRLYQKFISPLKRQPCCRFTPTCSSYAIEAFQEWGLICGLGLTVWRILRCNPFCAPGYDPVPKRRRRSKGEGDKKQECDERCDESEGGKEE